MIFQYKTPFSSYRCRELKQLLMKKVIKTVSFTQENAKDATRVAKDYGLSFGDAVNIIMKNNRKGEL